MPLNAKDLGAYFKEKDKVSIKNGALDNKVLQLMKLNN